LGSCYVARHRHSLRKHLPALSLPKGAALLIIMRDENDRPRNACASQTGDAFLREQSADAASDESRRDREMINQSTTAIMTAKSGSHNLIAVQRDSAQAGISIKVAEDFLGRIAFRDLDSVDLPPKRGDGGIIARQHFAGCNAPFCFPRDAHLNGWRFDDSRAATGLTGADAKRDRGERANRRSEQINP
jgi:hypothetical protein